MTEHVITVTEELVKPIADEMNLELVDVEFTQEGNNFFLRVYIDSPRGVDIEECGVVSEKLSEQLDKQDPIEQPYFLEVSSPGAERPLKKPSDFEKVVGKQIYMTTYEKIDGEKSFEGKLVNFDGETVVVEQKVKTRTITVEVPYDKVASARLAVVF
ncbi:ribosome maturation factor RimP [Guptibacillus algicola]|uniref:ribosome maturation factor RimP n=1 Tax=Guptibacillus algicola TaxID=225844 RepID=UPI001CD4D401|nr:ribosome maturation factor RimP [Alkalihalobacillus algicola]MCA0988078.1 ribosome maturation factor RimP [Alkalihalobacillus algicola]